MSPDPAADLVRLRAICLDLPRAAEKISHGTSAFFIEKGRVFAWFWHDHHGDGITAVLVKTAGQDEQALLIGADPALYFRPPYLGPAGWVGLRIDRGATDWAHVAAKVRESWLRVAPRRLAEAFGG